MVLPVPAAPGEGEGGKDVTVLQGDLSLLHLHLGFRQGREDAPQQGTGQGSLLRAAVKEGQKGQGLGLIHKRASFPGRHRGRSCQKATALAAATFRESTPWDMGMQAVSSQWAMVAWARPSPSVPRRMASFSQVSSWGSSIGPGLVAEGHGHGVKAQGVEPVQPSLGPVAGLGFQVGPGDLKDRPHAHPHGPAVEGVTAGGGEEDPIHMEGGCRAEDGSHVGGVYDAFQYRTRRARATSSTVGRAGRRKAHNTPRVRA